MYSSWGCGCNNGIDVLVTIPVACPTPMLMVAARTHPIGRRMAAVVEVGGGSRGGGKGTGKSVEMAPLNYSFYLHGEALDQALSPPCSISLSVGG